MEPGSPEWIANTVEELENLELARESVAKAAIGTGSVATEAARQAQLRAFDQRIASLFAELEPFAPDEGESAVQAAQEEQAALDALSPQPALGDIDPKQPVANPGTSDSDPFAADPFAAPSAPSFLSDPVPSADFGAPSSDLSSGGGDFGSGLDFDDDMPAKKKGWVIPVVIGAVGAAAVAIAVPMMGASSEPTLENTVQPAAAAIVPEPAAAEPAIPEPAAVPDPAPAGADTSADPSADAAAGDQPAADSSGGDNPQDAEPAQNADADQAKEDKDAQEAQPAEEAEPEEEFDNTPRGRKARRRARIKKMREARRKKREAAAAKRRESGGDKKEGGSSKRKRRKKAGGKGKKEGSEGGSKRRRVNLDSSGDPLG